MSNHKRTTLKMYDFAPHVQIETAELLLSRLERKKKKRKKRKRRERKRRIASLPPSAREESD